MDANRKLALEAFILLRSDVDSVQYPVVMVKLRDEIQGRGETIRLRGRITNDHNDPLGIWFPIHLFDGSLNRECQVLLPLAAALGLYSSQKSFQLRGRQGQRLYVKRLAFVAVHDDPDARRRYQPMDCANYGRHPGLDVLHHQSHRVASVDHQYDIESFAPQATDESRETGIDSRTLPRAETAATTDSVRRTDKAFQRSQGLLVERIDSGPI